MDLRTLGRSTLGHEAFERAGDAGAIFSPDGKSVLVWSDSPRGKKLASVWRVRDGRQVGEGLRFSIDAVLSFTGSAVIARRNRTFEIVDLAGKQKTFDMPERYTIVSVSEHGLVLLQSDSSPRELMAWDPITQKPLARLKGLSSIAAAVVDPHVKRFAVTRADGTTRVWDTDSCPTAKTGERVCSVGDFLDGSFNERLRSPASLLATACHHFVTSPSTVT
jgi:hypothetical protein